MAQFTERKAKAMAELASQQADRSRKGGLDAPIAALVDQVNSHPDFFTTSSCSGRITLFSEPHFSNAAKPKRKKKGGDWFLISHEIVDAENVILAVRAFVNKPSEEKELLVFRFEPFILSLECSSVVAAQELVGCAIASGFRESGITSISKRVIVAIRCSIRLEVPVAETNTPLVSEDYLRYLSLLANKKMQLNKERCDRFLESFAAQFRPDGVSSSKSLIEVTDPEYFKVIEAEDNLEDSGLGLDSFHDVCRSELSGCNSDVETLVLSEEILEEFHNVDNGVIEVKVPTKPPAPIEDHFQVTNGCNIRAAQWADDVKGVPPTLQACELLLSGPVELLQRWGHSACTLGDSLLILGGYGGVGRHSRLDDVLVLTIGSQALDSLECSSKFSPIMAQTASYINGQVWIVGGREGPHVVLDEVLKLDHQARDVSLLELSGTAFPPRHRHAAAAVGDRIYVFGGLGTSGVLGDLYVLDTTALTWCSVLCKGDLPSARHSHSLCAIGEKLYLFGGFDGTSIYGDVHVLDTSRNIWTRVTATGDLPGPRFSHSCTVVGSYIAMLGGCPTVKHTNSIFFLDTLNLSWKKMEISLPSGCLLARHTTNLVGYQLVIVGGGAACYAFGTMFSPCFTVDMRDCLSYLEGWSGSLAKTDVYQLEENAQGDEVGWALQLDREVAKTGKDALKLLGWLDSQRKALVTCSGRTVAFPVTDQAAAKLSQPDIACEQQQEVLAKCSREVLAKCGGELVTLDLSSNAKCTISPHSKLEKRVSLLLQEKGLSRTLLRELPKRWERVGDLGILPANSFLDDGWTSLGDDLWRTIASALDLARLARQGPVAANDTRDSGLVMLLGNDGWVEHRENGVMYCFDATKCMYSSGNVTERSRMGRLNCEGEIVVDLFAGIGYFVLPFLLRARATKLYACEWNPHALYALRWSLRVNKVEEQCTVLEGDNRKTAPEGIANRVCLGLIPTSEGSWAVAVKALRPEGGMLHVHENVTDTDEQRWIQYLLDRIRELAHHEGRRWSVSVVHVERVKWYAPHIRHIVVDLCCKEAVQGTI